MKVSTIQFDFIGANRLTIHDATNKKPPCLWEKEGRIRREAVRRE